MSTCELLLPTDIEGKTRIIFLPNLLKQNSFEKEVYIFTKDELLNMLRPWMDERTFHYFKDAFSFAAWPWYGRIFGKNQEGIRL